jgi:hypothetical protein
MNAGRVELGGEEWCSPPALTSATGKEGGSPVVEAGSVAAGDGSTFFQQRPAPRIQIINWGNGSTNQNLLSLEQCVGRYFSQAY